MPLLLEFRFGRNRAQLFFFLSLCLAQRNRLHFNHSLLTQGIEQGVQNDLQGVGILHQHPFHTFAVNREFSNWPRPTDVNPYRR